MTPEQRRAYEQGAADVLAWARHVVREKSDEAIHDLRGKAAAAVDLVGVAIGSEPLKAAARGAALRARETAE